ncbi:MAG: hypothetical protein ACK5PI_01315 [Acetobacteraceae bacterium]
MPIDPAFATPGRFFKGNLHTHSTVTDAGRAPEEVCAIYREAGYDFLSLTDHFLARFGWPIVDTRPWRTNSFTTILGAEVHAPATSLGEIWHILAVGLPTDFAPAAPDESGADLAARCIDAGAFVALAHPAWYALDVADADTIPGAHAVEIYNHTSQVRTDRGDGWYLLDQLTARGRRMTGCATDDAHFKCDDWFGGWVQVKADVLDPDALVAALKAGRYYSSQGPAIHDVRWGARTVEVECSPAARIMALGHGSANAYTLAPNQTRAVLEIDRLVPGGWGRVVVVDALGRKAWTNPVVFAD